MVSDCLANTTKDCGTDMTTVDLYEEFEELLEFKEKPKLPFAFKDDPVVLACGAYRIGNYPDFSDIEPVAEDRELAEKIKKHWLDKLTIQRLRGQTPSQFREKLGAFLVGNRPIYKEEIGMLYHLPHFYFEDLEAEQVINETAEVEATAPQRLTLTLKPLKTIGIKRRSGALSQYWWTDEQNRPYCLTAKSDGDYNRLCSSLHRFNSIEVSANIVYRPFMGTDRHFYKMFNVELLGVK